MATRTQEVHVTTRSKYQSCGDPILSEYKLREMVKAYLDFPEYVFDVETHATREKRFPKDKPQGDPLTNEVFWISFAGPGRCDVLPLGHPKGKGGPSTQLWRSVAFPILEPLLHSTTQRKIGANVKFDCMSTAKYYDGAPPPPPYGDILVGQHILNENLGPRSYALLPMTERHLRFSYEKIGKLGVETFPFLDASRYSYLDSKNTWLLWRKVKKLINEHRLGGVMRLEMDVLEVVIAMEMAGAPVDTDYLVQFGKKLRKRMQDIEYSLYEANNNEPFNLNAPVARGKFVYKVRGHKATVFTEKSNQASTKADHLEVFAKKDPMVKSMMDWMKLAKLHGTYIEGMIPRITPDGRLHTDFRQTGAATGRFSSAEPNLQNIPVRSDDGKEIRHAFWAPEGYVLVVADFSQIELRVLAHFTQDPLLIAAYVQGLDLHRLTAQTAYHVEDPTPEQRGRAKNVNFSITFGATEHTLVEKYGVPNLKEGKQLIAGFYGTYKKVAPWQDKIVDEARRQRPPHVTSLVGRRRRLGALMSTNWSERARAERQAVNFKIQGSAADINKMAMIRCYHALEEKRPESKLILTVHDEFVTLTPKKHANEVQELVREAMEGAYELQGLPLVADVKQVERWSEAK